MNTRVRAMNEDTLTCIQAGFEGFIRILKNILIS
jgi:hypothetical protein